MGLSQPEEAACGHGTESVAVLDVSDTEQVANFSLCVHCDLTGEHSLTTIEDAVD